MSLRIAIGGFLHESRDYPSLLHCNYCGRYYECKKDHRGWADSTTLRRLSPEEVAQHREVRG